jgi:uncharacterized protein YjeT (DUF2065 family)
MLEYLLTAFGLMLVIEGLMPFFVSCFMAGGFKQAGSNA